MRTSVVAMTFRAGAVDEPRGRSGLAALTQRLASGSAGKVASARERLDDVGALRSETGGAELTTFVTATASRHLALVLWFEALRMAMLDATPAALDGARKALASEIAARRRHDLAWHGETALLGLALGQVPPASGLDAVTLEDVRSFHTGMYAPGRAVLVVVGPTPVATVLALAKKTMGSVRRAAAPVTATVQLPQESRRHSSVRSPAMHRAAVAYGFRLPERAHADQPALTVAMEMLAGGRTSALHRELVRKKSSAFRVGAKVHRGSAAGLAVAYAEGPRFVKPMDLANAIQLQAIKLGGTDAVATAKQRIRMRWLQALGEPQGRARLLAEHELLDGDAGRALERDAIAKVNATDVQRVARTYFVAERASVVECFPAPIHLNEADQAALEAKKEKERKEREALEKKAKRRKRKKKTKRKKPTKKKKKTKKKPAKKKKTKKKRRR